MNGTLLNRVVSLFVIFTFGLMQPVPVLHADVTLTAVDETQTQTMTLEEAENQSSDESPEKTEEYERALDQASMFFSDDSALDKAEEEKEEKIEMTVENIVTEMPYKLPEMPYRLPKFKDIDQYEEKFVINGKLVMIDDMDFMVQVMDMLAGKARRDSGEICFEGCGTPADLSLLAGVQQFMGDDVYYFETKPSILTGPEFSKRGWQQFVEAFVSVLDRAGLDIYEGPVSSSGNSYTQGLLSHNSSLNNIKPGYQEVVSRIMPLRVSHTKVWSFLENGAKIDDLIKMPAGAMEALARQLGVPESEIKISKTLVRDRRMDTCRGFYGCGVGAFYGVEGTYQHGGKSHTFVAQIDRLMPIFERVSGLTDGRAAVADFYSEFSAFVLRNTQNIGFEGIEAIAKEAGISMRQIKRFAAKSAMVCMAEGCDRWAYEIEIETQKSGTSLRYEGMISQTSDGKYKVRIKQTESLESKVRNQAVEHISGILGLTVDEVKKYAESISIQLDASGMIRISFIQGSMGAARLLDVMGDGNLPDTFEISFLVNKDDATGAYYPVEPLVFGKSIATWMNDDGSYKEAIIAFDASSRISSVNWQQVIPGAGNTCPDGEFCLMVYYPDIRSQLRVENYFYDEDGSIRIEVMNEMYSIYPMMGMPVVMPIDGDFTKYADRVMVLRMQADGKHHIETAHDYDSNGVLIDKTEFQYVTAITACAAGYECPPPVSFLFRSLRTHKNGREFEWRLVDHNALLEESGADFDFNSLEEFIRLAREIENKIIKKEEVPGRELLVRDLISTYGFTGAQAKMLLDKAEVVFDSLDGVTVVIHPADILASGAALFNPLEDMGKMDEIRFSLSRMIAIADCAIFEDGTTGNCGGEFEIINIRSAVVIAGERRSMIDYVNDQPVNASNEIRDGNIVCIQAPCDNYTAVSKVSIVRDAAGKTEVKIVYAGNQVSGLMSSRISFVQFDGRMFPEDVVDHYVSGEAITSHFDYLVAIPMIMCAEGYTCEPPAASVALWRIARSQILTDGSIEELAVIDQENMITYQGEQGMVKGSIRMKLDQARDFELKFQGVENQRVLQKMMNVLDEIQGLADEYNALEKELGPLRSKLNELNDILRGEKHMGLYYDVMMIAMGHWTAIRNLKSWIEGMSAAIEAGDDEKAAAIRSEFEAFLNKEPYPGDDNPDRVHYSDGNSYHEVIRELRDLIHQDTNALASLPEQIAKVDAQIQTRREKWEAEAAEILKGLGDFLISFEPILENGVWGTNSWMPSYSNGDVPLWYPGSPGFIFLTSWRSIWHERRPFSVVLANGEKMIVESINGVLDPKFLSLADAMRRVAKSEGVGLDSLRILRSSEVLYTDMSYYLPDAPSTLQGFRHFIASGTGLDQKIFIMEERLNADGEMVFSETSMSIRDLNQEMIAASDLSRDGVLNEVDILQILNLIRIPMDWYGEDPNAGAEGDINQDGVVDLMDAAAVIAAVEMKKITEEMLIEAARAEMKILLSGFEIPSAIMDFQVAEMDQAFAGLVKGASAILNQLKNDLTLIGAMGGGSGDGGFFMIGGGPEGAIELEQMANQMLGQIRRELSRINVIIENEYDMQVELPIAAMVDILISELEKHGSGMWSTEQDYLVLKGMTPEIVGQFHPGQDAFLLNVFQFMAFSMAYGPSSLDLRDMMIRFARAYAKQIIAGGALDMDAFRDVLVNGMNPQRGELLLYADMNQNGSISAEEVFATLKAMRDAAGGLNAAANNIFDVNQDGVIDKEDIMLAEDLLLAALDELEMDRYERMLHYIELFNAINAEVLDYNNALLDAVKSIGGFELPIPADELQLLLDSASMEDRMFAENALLFLEIHDWVVDQLASNYYVEPFMLVDAFPGVFEIDGNFEIQVKEPLKSFMEEQQIGIVQVDLLESVGGFEEMSLEELEAIAIELEAGLGVVTLEDFIAFAGDLKALNLLGIGEMNEGVLRLQKGINDLIEKLLAGKSHPVLGYADKNQDGVLSAEEAYGAIKEIRDAAEGGNPYTDPVLDINQDGLINDLDVVMGKDLLFSALDAFEQDRFARFSAYVELFEDMTAEVENHNNTLIDALKSVGDLSLPYSEDELAALMQSASDEDRAFLENALLFIRIHAWVVDQVSANFSVDPYLMMNEFPGIFELNAENEIEALEPLKSFMESQQLGIVKVITLESVGDFANMTLEELEELAYGLESELGIVSLEDFISFSQSSLNSNLANITEMNSGVLRMHQSVNEIIEKLVVADPSLTPDANDDGSAQKSADSQSGTTGDGTVSVNTVFVSPVETVDTTAYNYQTSTVYQTYEVSAPVYTVYKKVQSVYKIY